MKFTPKTEAEIRSESLLQPGTYDFKVIEAEDKISSAGNDMIAVSLAVYRPDGNGFFTVTDYLMEKMAYKLRHFCEETGLIKLYEDGTLMSSDLEGRDGRLQLVIDPERTDKVTGKVYMPKNSVKDYGPGKGVTTTAHPVAKQPPAPSAEQDEEDTGVPF